MKYLFLFLFLFSAEALAQGVILDNTTQNIKTKDDICGAYKAYIPDNNVEYQAGVDAYGNAVTPADIYPDPYEIPKMITVPLTLDLGRYLNVPVDPRVVPFSDSLGTISIDTKENRIYYKGQEITRQIYTYCQKKR